MKKSNVMKPDGCPRQEDACLKANKSDQCVMFQTILSSNMHSFVKDCQCQHSFSCQMEKTQRQMTNLWTKVIGNNPTNSFATMLTFAMIESNERD